MAHPITPNEEAAAVTSCNGFDFVFTTDTPAHGEDDENFHILASTRARKVR